MTSPRFKLPTFSGTECGRDTNILRSDANPGSHRLGGRHPAFHGSAEGSIGQGEPFDSGNRTAQSWSDFQTGTSVFPNRLSVVALVLVCFFQHRICGMFEIRVC